MALSRNSEEISLTILTIQKKAAKLRRLYNKRQKGCGGRRPKKELFILYATYLLFKEKYPERKTGFTQIINWLNYKYTEINKDSTYDFNLIKLHKWRRRKPFKEMQWEMNWEDLRVAQKVSDKGANKGEMSPRKIMRARTISKQELEDLIPIILSHHIGNKKTSDKFVFNRLGK